MKAIKHISLLIFTLLATSGYGQVYTQKANECYRAKDYECARFYIDSAIVVNERYNSQTWQLRGLIYRKMETPETMDYRNISIESFVQAKNLDSTGQYAEDITKFLRNTIIRYYNDAVVELEGGQLGRSETSYGLYKEKYLKYIDKDHDFSASDIEYYNALGGACLKKSQESSGEEKEKLIAKGLHFYQRVIELFADHFQANFNVGITYYNQGADLIMNMDPLTPIEKIPEIEAQAQELFKKALPFLKKAHELETERVDVIEAITGCYYGLQDDENYLAYQKLLDNKNLPILLDKIEKDSDNIDVLRELVRIYRDTLKDEEKYQKYLEMLERVEKEE